MIEKIVEIILESFFEKGDLYWKNIQDEKELEYKLKKVSEDFLDKIKSSGDRNQEMDFEGLEDYVLNKHFSELKETCVLLDSQGKEHIRETFCSRACEEVSADKKEGREIVNAYITTIIMVMEQFYLHKNEFSILVVAGRLKEEIGKDFEKLDKRLERIEKTVSKGEKKISKSKPIERIRICSFPPKESDPKVEHLWDFSDRFQDKRFLKEEYSWEGIYKEIQEKADKLDRAKQYEVEFAAPYSIAFMAGRVMDSISKIENVPCQWIPGKGIRRFDPNIGEEGPGWNDSKWKTLDNTKKDFAISIGLSNPMKGEVEQYIKEENLPIGEVYHFVFPEEDNTCVKSGKHLEQLVKAVNQRIKNRWDDNNGTGMLHLFISGPVTFMFELGKRSRLYNTTQIYEFNTEGVPGYPKTYYPGWKRTRSGH